MSQSLCEKQSSFLDDGTAISETLLAEAIATKKATFHDKYLIYGLQGFKRHLRDGPEDCKETSHRMG